MKVFKQELRFQVGSFLRWTIGLIGVYLLFMMMFPTFHDEMGTLKAAMAAFPEEMIRSFGLGDSFFSDAGFVGYILSYIHIVLAIMGLLWGLVIIGRERIDKTSDMLLVRPVSRLSIIVQKIILGILGVFIVNALLLGSQLILDHVFSIDQTTADSIHKMIYMGMLLQLLCFAIGSVMAVLLKAIRNPVGIASAIGFGFYIMLLIARLIDNDLLMKLTPFWYTDSMRVLDEGVSAIQVMGLTGVSVLLLVFSVAWFMRSDVEA